MTIAASTLVLAVRRRERPVRELGARVWAAELAELAAEGFEAIDLVDSWLAPGELDESELRELRAAIAAAGVELAGVSVIRRSVDRPARTARRTSRSRSAASRRPRRSALRS